MKKLVYALLCMSLASCGGGSSNGDGNNTNPIEPNQTSDLTTGGTVTYLTTPSTISPSQPINTSITINGTNGTQYTVSYGVNQANTAKLQNLKASNQPTVTTSPEPCIINGSGSCSVSISTGSAYNGIYSLVANVYVNGTLASNNEPLEINVSGSPQPSIQHYAYVTSTNNNNKVLMYSVDSKTGNLIPISTNGVNLENTVTGNLSISPLGNYLYVNTVDNNLQGLSIYNINPKNGTLSFNSNIKTSYNNSYGGDYNNLVFSPNGEYAYLIGGEGMAFGYYNYLPTGSLELIGGHAVSGYGSYSSLAITHSGKYLYTVGDENIYMDVVSADGEPIGSGYIPCGDSKFNPDKIIITPNDKFAYVNNPNQSGYNGKVTMFTIDSKGVLQPLQPESTVDTGDYPIAFTTDATGKYLYVANHYGKSISMYSINQSTGMLTPLSPSITSIPNYPHDIVLGPDGKYVYVTYFNFDPDYDDRPGGIAIYKINNDGTLNLTNNIASVNSPENIAFY